MALFGFLNCYKPPAMTSRDVVNIVQRRLRKLKVGHAGTLDPLAEGVLVLGVGPAVRLVPYVQQQPKHYRATFRLGASSRSGDLEGDLKQHPDLPIPSRQQIESAAAGLVGKIEQTPPTHSAIWVDGRRAYQRARAGEEFEMPKRSVEVFSLQILRYDFPEVVLDIVCGSGTYVRTLGLDLALAAGSTSVMSHLCRQGVGSLVKKDAVSVRQLREDDIPSMLLPPTVAVSHLPQLAIDESDSRRLGYGLCITGAPTRGLETRGLETRGLETRGLETRGLEARGLEDDWPAGTEAAAVDANQNLRAIVRRKQGAWCPYRVFPLPEA